MKIFFTFTFNQLKKQKVNIERKYPCGYFMWIGSHGTVDRIVGYHFGRGFIADYCYMTHNHWLKDLFLTLKCKEGFIRFIRYI